MSRLIDHGRGASFKFAEGKMKSERCGSGGEGDQRKVLKNIFILHIYALETIHHKFMNAAIGCRTAECAVKRNGLRA